MTPSARDPVRQRRSLWLLPVLVCFLALPVLHAAHPPGLHAPLPVEGVHDTSHGQAHEHGSKADLHHPAPHEVLHALMECECLVCQLAQMPVVLPEAPSPSGRHAALHRGVERPATAPSWITPHARPPTRGPPSRSFV